jgi:predicted transcriptional regulator
MLNPLYILWLNSIIKTLLFLITYKELDKFIYNFILKTIMGRGSSQVLIEKLLESLTKGSKSITDISKETGLDRTAISKYLDSLEKSGILVEDINGKKKIFTLNIKFRTDTYFGLPIDKEKEKLIDSLYFFIRKYWKNITGKEPLKTHVHKTLYKINKKCSLNLPMGWYLFGALCVKPYDPFSEYSFTSLKKEEENCTKEVIDSFSKNAYAFQTKLQQYKEEGNKFYLLKEEILSYFHSNKFNKKTLIEISKKIRVLFNNAPKTKEDTIYQSILNEFQDLILDCLNELDEQKIIEIKSELVGAFEDVWKLIALFNYKKDLLQGKFYSEKELNVHILLDIIQQEREIIERCSEIISKLPQTKESKEENYIKLRNSLKNIKIEERKITNKNQEQLIEEFGLN